MTKLLVLNTSLSGENGKSSQLTDEFVTAWTQQNDSEIVRRDLASDDLPHLSGNEMAAWMTASEARTEEQKALAALSDELLDELERSDIIVLGMPMYNFGVPSVFKAWVDRVARAGRTFKYTEQGPQGLLEGKKVYVLAARGGMYAGTSKDSQTQYLNDFFAFIGITDVEFVYAEGLNMGEEPAAKAWSAAQQKIVELIGKQAA